MHKVDIVRQDSESIIHKQIEFRNGLMFVRLKKRRFPLHA